MITTCILKESFHLKFAIAVNTNSFILIQYFSETNSSTSELIYQKMKNQNSLFMYLIRKTRDLSFLKRDLTSYSSITLNVNMLTNKLWTN